ncbi:leucine-rich repeat and immunoglobulin-like domain-containing nogo receptor-interacting protein 1 [Genypterus blacodes]|uniref:leucine-rich repeat and immunoglobulin-like domain-containing nogo receptor-interacting protein 1 n=1 Tax=Genypterus blacodes TaxID=154954 RepID=UPI003F769F0D
MFEGTSVSVCHRVCRGVFYLLAAILTLTSQTRSPCPQTCRCNTAVLEVNCSGHQLTTVPNALPKDSKLLNLTDNKIKALAQQQFQTLTQLRELDLSDNILVIIEAEAFLGLQNLRTLHLARNRLKIIPVGAFAGLTKLQLLDISSNDILVFLDFTFRDLAALRCVKACDNDLVFISRHAFNGLSCLRELHLDGFNLTAVPTEALTQLNGLTRLHFHLFRIVSLPNYSFHHLGHLKELIVSHWPQLETLAGNSLFGLNLTSLTISNCNLSAVPYVALHHLVYLSFLDLSFNPITHIHGNLLGGLLRLQEFHLVGGALLYIELQAFRGLPHLKFLNVSRNLLTTLEMGVFHSVNGLEIVGIDNNPLACDCRLLWMVRRRSHLNFGGTPPVCTTSVPLQSWKILDLSETALRALLTCQRARILNHKPQAVRIDQGHTVVFYCSADGDPLPAVTWLNPQLRPLSSVGRIRVLINGSLEVRYAQPQDSGTYLCVASNAAGNDSLPITLHVQSFPSSPQNSFRLKGRFTFPSSTPGVNEPQQLPSDLKTLLIAVAIGFLSFLSSVTICFVFMFFWSKSKGQLKHTATIAYVPRSTVSGGDGAKGNYMETGRFTMKLI